MAVQTAEEDHVLMVASLPANGEPANGEFANASIM